MKVAREDGLSMAFSGEDGNTGLVPELRFEIPEPNGIIIASGSKDIGRGRRDGQIGNTLTMSG